MSNYTMNSPTSRANTNLAHLAQSESNNDLEVILDTDDLKPQPHPSFKFTWVMNLKSGETYFHFVSKEVKNVFHFSTDHVLNHSESISCTLLHNDRHEFYSKIGNAIKKVLTENEKSKLSEDWEFTGRCLIPATGELKHVQAIATLSTVDNLLVMKGAFHDVSNNILLGETFCLVREMSLRTSYFSQKPPKGSTKFDVIGLEKRHQENLEKLEFTQYVKSVILRMVRNIMDDKMPSGLSLKQDNHSKSDSLGITLEVFGEIESGLPSDNNAISSWNEELEACILDSLPFAIREDKDHLEASSETDEAIIQECLALSKATPSVHHSTPSCILSGPSRISVPVTQNQDIIENRNLQQSFDAFSRKRLLDSIPQVHSILDHPPLKKSCKGSKNPVASDGNEIPSSKAMIRSTTCPLDNLECRLMYEVKSSLQRDPVFDQNLECYKEDKKVDIKEIAVGLLNMASDPALRKTSACLPPTDIKYYGYHQSGPKPMDLLNSNMHGFHKNHVVCDNPVPTTNQALWQNKQDLLNQNLSMDFIAEPVTQGNYQCSIDLSPNTALPMSLQGYQNLNLPAPYINLTSCQQLRGTPFSSNNQCVQQKNMGLNLTTVGNEDLLLPTTTVMKSGPEKSTTSCRNSTQFPPTNVHPFVSPTITTLSDNRKVSFDVSRTSDDRLSGSSYDDIPIRRVDHTYIDVSQCTISDACKGFLIGTPLEDILDDGLVVKRFVKTSYCKSMRRDVKSLPSKLYELLSYCCAFDVASFRPHGRAFIIHDPFVFEKEFWPHFSKASKFKSFQRQLTMWGFRRITKGPDAGSYYHELFLRGLPHLIPNMMCIKVKGVGTKRHPDPASEPNFYELSKRRPLPALQVIEGPLPGSS